ncbi:MAG: hypothetical protein IKX33_09315 [Prevotella sp.]|nr:hypothetical protein [Prevotella sp.]
MRRPKWMTLKGEWTNERIARTAFYTIVALAVVIFLLFYFIGFSKPYSYDPNFKDPKFTPFVLGFVAFVIVIALAVAVWAVIATARRKGKTDSVVNGIPVARIALSVAAVTFIVMAITFITGSSETINANGKPFTNAVMLKGADMFVISSGIMLLLAAATAFYGMWHSHQVDK